MEHVLDEVLSIVRAEKMTDEAQPDHAAAPTDPQGSFDPSAPRVEPWLREILRCPQCRSALSDGSGPGGPELHCTNTACRRAYRIDDGIPVLLVDESRLLAN
jgi:uncharacterized protein YbaR (Trm112 family)